MISTIATAAPSSTIMTTGSTGDIPDKTSTVDHTSQIISTDSVTDQMPTRPHVTRTGISDSVPLKSTATSRTEHILSQSSSECEFCILN